MDTLQFKKCCQFLLNLKVRLHCNKKNRSYISKVIHDIRQRMCCNIRYKSSKYTPSMPDGKGEGVGVLRLRGQDESGWGGSGK